MINFQEHQTILSITALVYKQKKKIKKLRNSVCLNSKEIVTIISFLLLCREKFKVHIEGACSALGLYNTYLKRDRRNCL